MAIIHPTVVISSARDMPSLGMLLGTRVSTEIFENVDANGHGSFFGNEFEHLDRAFFERHIKPMNDMSFQIARTVNLLENPDTFRLMDQLIDFKTIPTKMELPILLFAPVRKLFDEGRIEGFGYIPETLPDEDMFGRLIDNFTCEDVAAASDDDGYYPISATMYSDDADLSDDELYAIRRTREFIERGILKNTDRDPTCIDLPRG